MSVNKINYPISKSQYISFTRCSNSFYLINQNLHQKENHLHSGNLEWHEFHDLCTSIFENTIQIPRTISKAEQKLATEEAVTQRKTILGGYFESSSYFTHIECLLPDSEGEGWTIIDFRPIGSNKLEIYRSFFFQKKLLISLGFIISDCKIFRVNSSYVLELDKVDRNKFLHIESVAEKLTREEVRFEDEWKSFSEFQNEPIFPIHEGNLPTCNSPKVCLVQTECFGESLERYEIFELREGQELPKKYFQMGIRTFAEMPDEDLSPTQRIQKHCHMTNEAYFDHTQLAQFFDNVTSTVAFLDFESINPLIPIYQNSHPFQHTPFLFSLHIWDSIRDVVTHFSYIHPPDQYDPRKEILAQLVANVPKDVTIFSFNDFFEKKIIEELVANFPEHFDFWNSIQPNFKDLALPFKKFWIYSPKQKGKASLKEILPAFSETTHTGLSIRAGQDANYQYLRLLKKQVTLEEKNRVLEDLVAYCKMDTYGLLILYKMIKEKLNPIC